MQIRNKLDDVLAENLKRLKGEGVFSSAQSLAKKAGISPSAMGYIMQTKEGLPTKKGSRSCRLDNVEAIATALGIHPIELLTSPSEHKDELLAAFERVEDELKASAVSVVAALAAASSSLAAASSSLAFLRGIIYLTP